METQAWAYFLFGLALVVLFVIIIAHYYSRKAAQKRSKKQSIKCWMMMTRKFHRLRRLTGAVLLLILIGLPFLRVDGESAFRFDIPSLRLLFFGTEIWMADFFIILIAVIFLTFLTLFTTTVFGRMWCGWLCPQTVLVDATAFVETARTAGACAPEPLPPRAGMVVSAVIAASLIGYFVSPYDLPSTAPGRRSSGEDRGRLLAALTVILFLDLIALRRRFCATACPYAKLQSVLFDDRTLAVAFDPDALEECMRCGACVKACPVGIDIRKGLKWPASTAPSAWTPARSEWPRITGRSLVKLHLRAARVNEEPGVRLNPLITGVMTVHFPRVPSLSLSVASAL